MSAVPTPFELFTPDSEFLTTDTRAARWAIPYNHACLNARADVLLNRNRDTLAGARVLDLASHIGTFSYAALQMNAAFVHGVDTEADTIRRAEALFANHSVPPEQFRFEVRDAFELLESCGEGVYDTIFCFGMLYYTAEPYRLLTLMKRAARRCILLDTFTAAYAALQGKDALGIHPHVTDEVLNLPILFTTLTQSEKKDYTLPESFAHKDRNLSLTTFPSIPLLETWFASLGLRAVAMDWSAYIEKPCHWKELWTPQQKKASHWADVYSAGVRVAYRLDVA
ncbi:class I SAM-dependent methyltransferase [Nitrospina gracilis]|uniref:class I SAM-dependent methyltransferase n=1 Tax=Nitrospina gracilis TaxID=35801 RepID=UPI001F178B54|nr:methyltransferase domain-containing protein [Nitrospina gracilis]MCF8719823.1 putative nicotinamide N-methyase [Nitrospina gracilis Nb-211]